MRHLTSVTENTLGTCSTLQTNTYLEFMQGTVIAKLDELGDIMSILETFGEQLIGMLLCQHQTVLYVCALLVCPRTSRDINAATGC